MTAHAPKLFTGIDHPAISCQDLPSQIRWYCDTLGMKLVGDDGKEPASVLLSFGNSATDSSLIELMPVRNPGSPKPADVPRFCQGLRHVALRVSNFDQAYARLKSAGVQFLFEPAKAVGGGMVVSFRDPEGNELQIVER